MRASVAPSHARRNVSVCSPRRAWLGATGMFACAVPAERGSALRECFRVQSPAERGSALPRAGSRTASRFSGPKRWRPRRLTSAPASIDTVAAFRPWRDFRSSVARGRRGRHRDVDSGSSGAVRRTSPVLAAHRRATAGAHSSACVGGLASTHDGKFPCTTAARQLISGVARRAYAEQGACDYGRYEKYRIRWCLVGFSEAKQRVLRDLQAGNFVHEVRRNISSKNLRP